MDCQANRPELHRYLDGDLDAERKEAVADHLARCADCTATLAELENVGRLLRRHGFAPAPADLFDRVRAAAGARTTASIGLRLAAAGLGALLVGASWSVGSPFGENAAAAPNPFTDYFRTAAGSISGSALFVADKDILNTWPESRVLAWARQERKGK